MYITCATIEEREEKVKMLKMYHVSYFDDSDSGEAVTIFAENKSEAENLFFEIGSTLYGGIGGGLNYIDELTTLEADEEQLVREYFQADITGKRRLVHAYVELLERYGEEPTEDEIFLLQPEAKR